jgi:hypothetical protein
MNATAVRFGSPGPGSSDRDASRLGSWRRWLLGAGPIVLAALFLVRATTPVIDPLLLGIFVVLVAATIALVGGSRVGAGVVLVLGLALFQPTTAREFSFSLTAIDSDLWRVWAAASVVALGWTLVAAVAVLAAGDRVDDVGRGRLATGVAGALGLGAVLVAVFPMLSPQPAFGRDLDDAAIEAMPVIELVNFAYEPIVVDALPGETFRARLENPSDLPHTFTVEALDLEVYLPAGRWAIVEIGADAVGSGPLAVVCTIGDHLSLGMAGVIEFG